MRSAWRVLLLRGGFSLNGRLSSAAGLAREPLPSFQVPSPFPSNPSLLISFLARGGVGGPGVRDFSSETVSVDVNGADHSLLIKIFSGPSGPEDVKVQLESAGISMDHGYLNSVLRNLDGSPNVARRLFNWVAEADSKLLSSKTYNLMLGILGAEGKTAEFWEMLEIMKKKGYGLSKNAFLKASKGFDEKGMDKDLDLLKEIYESNSPENYIARMSSRVCKILREGDELGNEVWKELKALDANFSPDLVAVVLDKLSSHPAKAFLFFRWAADNSSFKAERRAYNAMARVLGREDCSEDFWAVLKEMRDSGHELDSETYSKVSKRFLARRMTKEAVDLYEFAMAGEEKPSPGDFLHLLRKIVVSRELELGLVSRTVRVFTEAGYPVKDSIFSGVLKSLASAGRLGDCGNLVKAMEEGGFSASSTANDWVAIGLCNARRPDEATRFVLEMERSGCKFSPKTWAFLVQSYSLAGSTEKALSCFHRIIERNGCEKAGCAFDALVTAYLRKNKAVDAYRALAAMVEKNQLQPWQTTYQLLIERLLREGKLKEASSLLGLMKTHGYPPFIDPFFGYISRFGSGEDAMVFLKAMTVKDFPSISVFIRILEAVLQAGRKEVADDLLSRTPGYVRSHADVLGLIFSFKSSVEPPSPEPVPI